MPYTYKLKDIKKTSSKDISDDHHDILNKNLIDLELPSLPIKSNHRAWQDLYERYFPCIEVSEEITYFDAFIEQYEKIFRDGLDSKWILKNRSEAVKNDKCIVFQAVSMHGHELQWAAPRFFSDEDIVIVAVDNNCNALKFASERLRNKDKVILSACSGHRGWALEHASVRAKDSDNIVPDVVSKYGLALQYASKRLRNDPYTVFLALSSNAYASSYVGDEIKKDPYYQEFISIKDDDYSLLLTKQRKFFKNYFANKQKSARKVVNELPVETKFRVGRC